MWKMKTEKVQAFAEEKKIPIVGEIPRSDEIIRWEDQGTDCDRRRSQILRSVRDSYELAEKLLERRSENSVGE